MVETEKELSLFIGGPLDNKWLEIGMLVKVCKLPVSRRFKAIHHSEYTHRPPVDFMIYNEERYLENSDRYRVFVLEGYDRIKTGDFK